MKTVKDKYLVVGADFAGYPLEEAVVAHLKEKGWKITDLGVVADSDPNDTENMFHRVGLRVGAQNVQPLVLKERLCGLLFVNAEIKRLISMAKLKGDKLWNGFCFL